jgi:hypothetical protein
MPAKQQHRNVVVPMQKHQFLFPQDDEQGVEELGNLGEDEQLHPQARAATSVHDFGTIAQKLVERKVLSIVHNVWHGTNHSPTTEEAEQEVPTRERPTQVEGLSVFHVPLAKEDEESVQNSEKHRQ